MDKDRALKLALEALEFIPESGSMLGAHAEAKRLEAITAIKEALAQPEQESDDLTIAYMTGFHAGKNKDAPQREWVGLTEEEYKNIRYGSDESGPYVSYGEYDEGYECGSEIEIYVDDFAKAIEAKLREKNGG